MPRDGGSAPERHAASIPPDELEQLLRSHAPLALLDPREEAVFAAEHLLLASNLPLSRFETGIEALVPRRSLSIVLVDGGDGSADRAERILRTLGYADVRILRGGIAGWREAGFPLFSGVFVPSKAFGEWVEATYGTPFVTPEELAGKQRSGESLVVLDSRPFEEFKGVAIPGALNCPASELPAAIAGAVPDEKALVVVNCGGRTRSIIGAQVLRNLGLPNPVVALKDGTMGWHLAGFEVERGADRRLAPADRREGMETAARTLAERAGVRFIDLRQLDDFEVEADLTTLYRFDVRSPERYHAGHCRGFLSAHGVQLIQATDTFIADRSARIVLADDDRIAAPATASWLRQMGLRNIFITDEAPSAEDPAAASRKSGAPNWPSIEPSELNTRLGSPTLELLDLAPSREHRCGHVPRARFASRVDAAEIVRRLPASIRTLALTSSDGQLASFAAADFAEGFGGEVVVLAGGTRGWQAAGLPMETGFEAPFNEPRDVFVKPFDRAEDREAAMSEYLAWEVGLLHRIDGQGLDFQPLPPVTPAKGTR